MSLVKLILMDSSGYLVRQSLAVLSEKLKSEIEAFDNVPKETTLEIKLPTIRATIFRLVMDWIYHHREDPPAPPPHNGRGDAENDGVSEWDRQYLANMEPGIKMEVLLAADYLQIKGLVQLVAKAISAKIRGKTVREIREAFKIKNDFKPNEEEVIMLENRWCEGQN